MWTSSCRLVSNSSFYARRVILNKINKMKFSSSSVGLLAVGSMSSSYLFSNVQGWTIAPANLSRQTQQPLSSFARPSIITTRLSSAVAADEQEAVLSTYSSTTTTGQPLGQVLAQGAIVSTFPGGMTAVRLNDEIDIPTVEESLTMDVPDSLLPAGALSSAAKKQPSTASADLQGKEVLFPDGRVGVVVAHRPPVVYIYAREAPREAGAVDGLVKVYSNMASVRAELTPSILDCFGCSRTAATDYETTLTELRERAMFAPIPQVKDIALINNPLLTGITMIDTLAPIGKGQNMLLVGHNLPDMRNYVVDMLRAQTLPGSKTKCIYASTDPDDDVVARLQAAGVADSVYILTPDIVNDEVAQSAQAVAIAASACAIGETFAIENGDDALVIVDTINAHKILWDATTRVLVNVFGVDAVVKGDREGGASSEMRAFFSSLIQRSAQYNSKRGGGSVTLLLMQTIPKLATTDSDTVFQESDFDGCSAKIRDRIRLLTQRNIPLTAETLRKIDIPIPSASEGPRRLALQHVDDLISMSDGQIWLDERLEEQRQRQPPLDPQRSVTRIGIGADTDSRADAPAIQRVVGEGLRLTLSQAASMDGAELVTTASRKQIQKQNALLLAMHQPSGQGARRLSESCTLLLAATEGYLNDAVDQGALCGTPAGAAVVSGLLEHVVKAVPDTMANIDATFDMNDDEKKTLQHAIASFFQS